MEISFWKNFENFWPKPKIIMQKTANAVFLVTLSKFSHAENGRFLNGKMEI